MDDCETHEKKNHLFVSRRLLVAVTECDGPLRQFHHSKDGVLVTSTCNDASEWCVTHAEKHGTHDHPPFGPINKRSLERTFARESANIQR